MATKMYDNTAVVSGVDARCVALRYARDADSPLVQMTASYLYEKYSDLDIEAGDVHTVRIMGSSYTMTVTDVTFSADAESGYIAQVAYLDSFHSLSLKASARPLKFMSLDEDQRQIFFQEISSMVDELTYVPLVKPAQNRWGEGGWSVNTIIKELAARMGIRVVNLTPSHWIKQYDVTGSYYTGIAEIVSKFNPTFIWRNGTLYILDNAANSKPWRGSARLRDASSMSYTGTLVPKPAGIRIRGGEAGFSATNYRGKLGSTTLTTYTLTMGADFNSPIAMAYFSYGSPVVLTREEVTFKMFSMEELERLTAGGVKKSDTAALPGKPTGVGGKVLRTTVAVYSRDIFGKPGPLIYEKTLETLVDVTLTGGVVVETNTLMYVREHFNNYGDNVSAYWKTPVLQSNVDEAERGSQTTLTMYPASITMEASMMYTKTSVDGVTVPLYRLVPSKIIYYSRTVAKTTTAYTVKWDLTQEVTEELTPVIRNSMTGEIERLDSISSPEALTGGEIYPIEWYVFDEELNGFRDLVAHYDMCCTSRKVTTYRRTSDDNTSHFVGEYKTYLEGGKIQSSATRSTVDGPMPSDPKEARTMPVYYENPPVENISATVDVPYLEFSDPNILSHSSAVTVANRIKSALRTTTKKWTGKISAPIFLDTGWNLSISGMYNHAGQVIVPGQSSSPLMISSVDVSITEAGTTVNFVASELTP